LQSALMINNLLETLFEAGKSISHSTIFVGCEIL